MKFDKVVYLRYMPLTRAIYNDFYFDDLIKNNIQVNYLDLTALFFNINSEDAVFDFENTIKIGSYKELKDYFRRQDKNRTLYISIMTFEGRVFKLFRLFSRFNLNLGVFARGAFPHETVSKKSKIVRIIKKVTFEKVKGFIMNRLAFFCKKKGYIKSYDYIFKAGKYGYYGLGLGSEIDIKKAKIIEVNTVDYDEYLLHRGVVFESENNNIVFMDQYLPYHSDSTFFNIKSVEATRYYKELNLFFDKLEAVTGKNVIIAAHPKAELYKEFNPFNSRSLFFNQSNDLVRDAWIVLTHASTAVGFPICYKKRVILLESDHLNERLPHFGVIMKSLVKTCGFTILAMDKQEKFGVPEYLNFEQYDLFKYDYLTSLKSENQLSKDIFIEFIKE